MNPSFPSLASHVQRLIAIGGGAAGFFGAIHAKLAHPDWDVVILEAAAKPLGKVKISGGGRCNVTHACFDPVHLVQYYPRGSKALRGLLSRFNPKDTVQWFESRGVTLKTEPDGRIFPVTDDSQTVINCLMTEAQRLGVRIITRQPVKGLSQLPDDRWLVNTPDLDLEADAILLASGGNPQAYRWLEALGHKVVPPVPSLFTFKIRDDKLTGLAGTSFSQVQGKLLVAGEKPIIQSGPMLITHWGLSGPVILRLSAWGARVLHGAHYQATLHIDFFPNQTEDTLRHWLLAQKAEHAKRHIGNTVPEGLTKRFWEQYLTTEDINPETVWADIQNKAVNRLAAKLKQTAFNIDGKGEFKEEFVTAGGVDLREVDFKTMQSKLCPGLYFAGEILDIDGLTGGFNFQNAWSTGFVAGSSITPEVRSKP